MIGIYKITSPSGKIYIGSSLNINKRINYYKSNNCKGQVKLYNSLYKYGWENHNLEILEECEFEKLYERERHYGEFYNVLDENGLNCVLPNNGEKRIGVSESTKLKMSLAKKGNKNTFFGKTHTIETREKIRSTHLGRKLSLEHRKKVSQNSAKVNSKKVLDALTNIVYNSIKEAAIALGYVHSTLRSRLNVALKNSTTLTYYDS